MCYHFFMQRQKVFMFVMALVLASPALAQQQACRAPLKPMLRAEMYFGRDIQGEQIVSDREWARFLAHELTPRFPHGLTVADGWGEWRNGGTGALVREPSKVVVIVAAEADDLRARIDTVADAYKEKFKQESVGIVLQPVCATF
jgi:hypothetical protein